jgi:beta-lactamase class D
MQAWIDKVGYGNRDIGGGIDRFWLSGALRISAVEQIAFLRRLAAGTLPFSARSQETVRRITIQESAPDYVLHGKTGLATHEDIAGKDDLGWYVGWVERGGRRWFFAFNMDLPHGIDDAPKRIAIARAVLAKAGALPSDG